MKHVTIKDIARSLCISVSTVSRALTDDKNIRKETREMVVEEAKRLGYKRNPVAMNLKMGRTNTIGVIVPEMHTPYASQVINGIQEVLYKKISSPFLVLFRVNKPSVLRHPYQIYCTDRAVSLFGDDNFRHVFVFRIFIIIIITINEHNHVRILLDRS